MADDQSSWWSGTQKQTHGVKFATGGGGLPMLEIETESSFARIYLHGAHVAHFQVGQQPPLLFLSKASRFEPQQAIRGGIPIILPWFGSHEGLPAHGCARNRAWELREIRPGNDGSVAVRLGLDFASVPGFPPFAAEYLVSVGAALVLELAITNRSSGQDLIFEECLHTYFSVGDIATISIAGLAGAEYLDKVDAFKRKTEGADAIGISSEVDRVYLDTVASVEIIDPRLRRRILVEKQNSASTVVWNPWIEKARQMADFGDDEYREMVCVESGNVGPNKVTLRPGMTHRQKVRLSSASI